MALRTSTLHVRIDDDVKAQAQETLAAMGLTMSDAVRLFLRRLAADRAFPFDLEVPNAETRSAIEESRALMAEGRLGRSSRLPCRGRFFADLSGRWGGR